MYSVVLMMAMTTGADMPDHRNRHGCCGCSGTVAVSVACSGGRHHRHHRCSGRHHGHHRHACHGCSGGCSGVVVSTGCSGGWVGAGCSGAYGGVVGSGSGCSGGVVVPYGGTPHHGPGMGGAGSGGKLPPPKKGKGTQGPAAQATTNGVILVSLPADARLTVDGRPTTQTSASRSLVTPDLQPGYEYYYTLRAEIIRDGQAVTQTQRIAVRPGEESRVSFDFSSTGVALNQ